MRALIGALVLLATPVYAFDWVPLALVKELAAPVVDADGCAAASDKQRNADGVLVECGVLVNEKREGYWVYEEGSGYFMHGWYREGNAVGTWLALTASGALAGVWRFDQTGAAQGVSYGLERDGRLAWKQMHVQDKQVFACGGRNLPC
ncbi:MAG: hypothetical protein ACN6O6_13840 [Pseudomonas sp.]|uniref:hypothetical protein n=1 Tax=Pseudomonas sp. TaxID=306 RepID=UPI003D0DC74F